MKHTKENRFSKFEGILDFAPIILLAIYMAAYIIGA